jgi:hypothetical protein
MKRDTCNMLMELDREFAAITQKNGNYKIVLDIGN